MSKKTVKRLGAVIALLGMAVVLTACGTSTVTAHSTGIWDRYVIYNAAQFILWLAKIFGGNAGIGIIVFTLLIRILIFPLSYISLKSMGKQQEIAPQLKALQQKYKSKDTETQRKLQQETQKLYAEEGINPIMGCLPLAIQMPFLFALYQAIFRTDALKTGHFLWLNLAQPDPYFIMPILAALFTLLTSLVSTLAQPQRTTMSWAMVAISPIMILVMAFQFPSALAIYWVVTNAFSLVQTFAIQNPFKLKRQREAKVQAQKDKEKAKRKALKNALRKRS
ncbi:YidC/Oxa1 family membrane protein insertase [Lacticaseibacillus sp. N501-2]|uniref:YidC/Oxa1 family membrane protein insertase n=1 Tax=Lacticaseibacillus salsurae TaxID=3367729 RepID=UPI0038B2F49C